MKSVLLKPDGIEELEKRIPFKYVSYLSFEDAKDVLARGQAKLQNNLVAPQALELGQKYIEKINAAYIPRVSIRWINDKIGYGLFAEEEILNGSYVGEYTGIVRRNDRRYFEPLNNYCYEYPVDDEIGRSFVIDATQGNLTRFINHSSKPNLQPTYAFYDGYYHLIFISLRLIQKGEEFSYDYGESYWNLRGSPLTLSL
jgi:SET domain-containing protein